MAGGPPSVHNVYQERRPAAALQRRTRTWTVSHLAKLSPRETGVVKCLGPAKKPFGRMMGCCWNYKWHCQPTANTAGSQMSCQGTPRTGAPTSGRAVGAWHCRGDEAESIAPPCPGWEGRAFLLILPPNCALWHKAMTHGCCKVLCA